MIERPLLFTAPMARAMIDGTKTETRSLTGLEKINERPDDFLFDGFGIRPADGFLYASFKDIESGCLHFVKSRYGMAGDYIWGREEFSLPFEYKGKPKDAPHDTPIHYWESGNPVDGDWSKPKPSIHLPRWASRIRRELADVRVERLDEIDDAGCEAEGCYYGDFGRLDVPPRFAYRAIWEGINGKNSWDRNPWVWVLVFKPEARA